MKNPSNPIRRSLRKKKEKESPKNFLHTPVPLKPQLALTPDQEESRKRQHLYFLKYTQLRGFFSASNISHIILRRILINPEIPIEYLPYPLLLLISETSLEMMFNDFEIIV